MKPGNPRSTRRSKTFSPRAQARKVILCCALAAAGCGPGQDPRDPRDGRGDVRQASASHLIQTTCALAQGYAAVRYLDPDGADATSHDGGPGLPWKSLTYALGRLQAGEMLCVRPGTYHGGAEHELRYDNTGHHTMVWVARRSGVTHLPLLVRGSDPLHRPVFTLEDPGLARATWRRLPDAALPAPAPGADVARTVYVVDYTPAFPCAVKTPQCRAMGGYVHVSRRGRVEALPLVPYTDRASFLATVQRQHQVSGAPGMQQPVYIGPGVYYQPGDGDLGGKLHIRLDNTSAMGDQGYSVGTDPNALRLELLRTSDAYHFFEVNHMTLEDLIFVGRVWFYGNTQATIPRGITLRRTLHRGFVAKRSLLEIHARTARVEGAVLDGGFPRWIYRSDVKTMVSPVNGDPHGPAWSFHGANLVLQGGPGIVVRDSRVRNAFMGIQVGLSSLATTGVEVRGNVIRDVTNDGVLMLSNAHDVDISGNLLLDCFAGVTTTGSLPPLVKGRVHVHHNIISLSSTLCGRDPAPGHARQYTTYPATDADGDGRCENRAFGLHSNGQGEAINVYNNTVVAATTHHSGALGLHLRPTSGQPHHVYRNIVIQREATGRFSERLRANDGASVPSGAGSARAGTTIADGNLYWRTPRTCGAGQSSQPMFAGYMINRYHLNDWGVCSFPGYRQQHLGTLSALQNSDFAAASSAAGYYDGHEKRSRFELPRLTPGLRPLSSSAALQPGALPAGLPRLPSPYTGACAPSAAGSAGDACALLALERRFSLPPRLASALAALPCKKQRLTPSAVDADDARFAPAREAFDAGALKELAVHAPGCPTGSRAMADDRGRRYCLFFSQQARDIAGRAAFSPLRPGATLGLLLSGHKRACPQHSLAVEDKVGGLTFCAYSGLEISPLLRGLRPEFSTTRGYIGYSWRVK